MRTLKQTFSDVLSTLKVWLSEFHILGVKELGGGGGGGRGGPLPRGLEEQKS